MRTFIAIELPQHIRDKLFKLQTILKKSNADVKWVEPRNIHLTLKFLGEIDKNKSVKIAEIIEDAAKKSRQFRINLSSIGAFPDMESAQVIWVGIDKGNNEIETLAKELEERFEILGILKEKRLFSPHITIGRVKNLLNKDKLAQALRESESYFSGKNIEFDVTKINLFKSILGPSGPAYETLKEVNINTT